MVDHLREVAADGLVPAEALTTGPQDRSKAWWNEFRKKVVAEAQAAGLCAGLWDLRSKLVLLGAGVVLLLLYAVATGFNQPDEVERSNLYDAVTLGGILAAFALGAAANSKRQTSTGDGLVAASRWLGVKRALDESPSFEVLPPSGVAVWERHLAYACALGVAPRSIQALPMGAESDTEVWTASGGEWRKVAVAYPRFRPGWGRHPLLALGLGALGSLFGWGLLRLATGDLGGDSVGLKVFALVVFALAVLVLTRSLPQLLFGFLDLFGSRTVEGPVLRARTRWAPIPYTFQGTDREYLRFFIAIDDGRSPKLTAYRVKPDLYDALPQGSKAELKVTPNLGYVTRRSG